MLTHRQLRYFVEIVQAGSFSEAAERLFIAQSALSRQVRDMEALLQVQLLVRDKRSLTLTPAGQSLLEDAKRILQALNDAAARAVQAQRGVHGCLQLLHSSSVPLTLPMLTLLRDLVQQHPGVNIDIGIASSEHQALDIAEGRADLGLARAPVLRRHRDVVYQTLWQERLVLLLPDQHAWASRASVTLAELRTQAFVAVPHVERGGLSHRVAELCRAHGFEPQPAAVRSRKWSQMALVQAGLGIAVAPVSMAASAPAGVRAVPLAEAACTSEVLGLWRGNASPLVHHVLGALRAFTPAQ